MFKKTITYEDFSGNPHTEDFYFHISKAELLALAADGDAMQDRIRRITESRDGAAILSEFRELIKLSAGIRSEDGQRFIKDEKSQSLLMDSPAFDELLMELATDENAAVEFVKQLIPDKMQKEMLARLKKDQAPDPFAEPTYEDGSKKTMYVQENRHPTSSELQAMSKDELVQAMAWKQSQG